MSTLLNTPVIGLEDVQRAAFYVFFANMNNVLEEIADYWKDRDERFDEVTGRTTSPTTLETIPDGNFHEGHKPSLIQSDPSGYPNLAVFAMRAEPSPESQSFDQMDAWLNQILVEIMVKASDEDTVNRRVQRMTEAVVICLRQNQTLGGAITGLENSPSVTISDVFALPSDTANGGYGDRLLWQGAAIQWQIRKDAVTPPPGGSIFSNASKTDYSQFVGLDIDQAP